MSEPTKDYAAVARLYCDQVLAGRIVACKWVKLACKRYVADLGRQDATWYFSAEEAFLACDYIEALPHVEGLWSTPTITLEPWQVFIVCAVFGFRRKTDGRRRFDTSYVECARGNAKSTLTSAISLYCLTSEGEAGPQVKIAATTGRQARIVFDVAKKMAERTADLREAFDLEPMANAIVCNRTGGAIQPINAKSSTQDGLTPHLTVIDELHAHKDRSLFDVLKSAQQKRSNPLAWYITTAGYNTESVCIEQRTLVTKILEGIFAGEHYFGVIYTLDDGDDPFDEKVWPKSNPNLGVSVNTEKLRRWAAEAKVSPDSAGEFKTKGQNLWLSSGKAWLSIEQWDTCASPSMKIEQFHGEQCWIGADLASKNDVAALAALFVRDDILHAFLKFYLPRDLVEACARRTSAHYLRWAEAGVLTLTEGDMIDYNRIEEDIRTLCLNHDVASIAFDPYQSNQISTNLATDGLPARIVNVTVQTMSEPAKELEARIQVGKFRHDGNPMLRWMASNVTVMRDYKGNIFPRKEKKDSPLKIDGIMAMLQAGGPLLDATSQPQTPAMFESRGVVVV